jgi:hypothetical protein
MQRPIWSRVDAPRGRLVDVRGHTFVGGAVVELGKTTRREATGGARGDPGRARPRCQGPGSFRKIVSGRKLWNYDKKELEAWKAAF